MAAVRGPWHLDRRVPIAMIMTIAAQTVGAIWWAATMNSAVNSNHASVVRLDSQVEAMRTNTQVQAVQLGRIEESVSEMRNDIARLIAAMERNR